MSIKPGTVLKAGLGVAAIATGVGIGAAVYEGRQGEAPRYEGANAEREEANANVFCKVGITELRRIMGSEELPLLEDKTWGSVTNVFSEPQVNRSTLQLDPVSLQCVPNLTTSGVEITGSLEGNALPGRAARLGVHFKTLFEALPDATARGMQLKFNKDVVSNPGGLGPLNTIGVEYPREFDADLNIFIGRAIDSSNPKQMMERMQYIQDILKGILNIPQKVEFIPTPNLTGFATMIDESRTGYGLYIATNGDIDGYTVSVRLHEGLSGDKKSWEGIAQRYELDPTKVTFAAILQKVKEDLMMKNGIREIMRKPPMPGTQAIGAIGALKY